MESRRVNSLNISGECWADFLNILEMAFLSQWKVDLPVESFLVKGR